jgi:hypothetical protein
MAKQKTQKVNVFAPKGKKQLKRHKKKKTKHDDAKKYRGQGR